MFRIYIKASRPAEDDCQKEEQDAVTAPYIPLRGTAAPLIFPVSHFVLIVKYPIGAHHPEDQIIRGQRAKPRGPAHPSGDAIEQGKHYIHTDSAHSKQNRSVFYIVRESCGQCIRTCQLHDLLLQQVQVPRQIKTGQKQRNSGCSIYRILCCRRENAPACDTDY